MNEQISVQLQLERNVVVRGESAYFNVLIKNVSGKMLSEALTLFHHNRALIIKAQGPGGIIEATQRSRPEREGIYAHGPRQPRVGNIPPGGTLTFRGDLLEWLAELAPGSYKVTATYNGVDIPANSPPVEFRVLPADPVAIDTPRYGQRLASAPLAAAWVHRFAAGTPEAGKFGVFYQHQSQDLPRSPIHGLCVAMLNKPVAPLASTVAASGVALGHVVWLDGRKLAAATINVERPQLAPVQNIAVPYRGLPVRSPLTMRNGTLQTPYFDQDRQRASLLTITPDVQVTSTEVPLGNHKPVGPNVWVWLNDARLQIIWAKTRGREIATTWIPLDDIQAGFSTPVFINVDQPVLWMDGYLDMDAAMERRPPDGPTPLPDVVAWLLQDVSGGLACTKVNLSIHQSQTVWSFAKPQNSAPEVVSSVVTSKHELALILKDEQSRLYYASTGTSKLCPLAEVTGVPIGIHQVPSLMSSGEDGVAPWVYVRYLDPSGPRIAYIKLEPALEHDPMDGPRRPEQGDSED